MDLQKTDIEDLYIIQLKPHTDNRGSSLKTFSEKEFSDAGIPFHVAEVYHSYTEKRGTIRGMHFQRAPRAQGKIVSCTKGTIYDVVADIRDGSPSFGAWLSFELIGGEHTVLYIPKGCAHGFQTLTDMCEVEYFMSDLYAPEYEGGVRWDDPLLHIEWPVAHPTVISQRDAALPLLVSH